MNQDKIPYRTIYSGATHVDLAASDPIFREYDHPNDIPPKGWGIFSVMPPTEIKEFPVTESGVRFKEAIFEIKGIPGAPLVIHRFDRKTADCTYRRE